MIRIDSIDVIGAGGNQSFKRRSIEIPKGKKVMGWRLKTTVTINNATGGAKSLSDAEKQALLSKILLTLSEGPNDNAKPYDSLDGQQMRDVARYCYGTELRGYNDGTTGLAKSIPNGAGQLVTFDMVIPTGKFWFLDPEDQRMFGVGRSQARNQRIGIEVVGNTTFATSCTITNVQVVLMADLEPCKGDPIGTVPYLRRFDEVREDVVIGTDGIPLLVMERSAVHASSALTAVSVFIDDEVIHRNVSAQDTIQDYNQAALANAAGSLVDRFTVLYAIAPSAMSQLKDLPSGRARVKQDTKTLATMLLTLLWLPVQTQSDVEADVLDAVAAGRSKTIKAVGVTQHRGRALPPRVASVLGSVLVDRDDKEFEQLPGLVAEPNKSEVKLDVPAGLAARVAATAAVHEANGEKKAAEDVRKAVSAAVPGAIPSARGFVSGKSPLDERVRGLLK